jgi:magnesium-transporting ATPase (P-type)
LNRFHRYLFYTVVILLFLSGVIWAYFNYLAGALANVDFWKSLALKIHGAAAMATLILIGTVLMTHVRFAWRARRNRINGILFLCVLGILTVTGYGLYYFGNEWLRSWTSWIHLAIGLILPLALVLHIFFGRRTRPVSVRKRVRPRQVAQETSPQNR